MSRRQRTTLVLSLRIPVPAGHTQRSVLADVAEALKRDLALAYPVSEFIIRIEGRETVYL